MPKNTVPLPTQKINSAKPKDKLYKLANGGGLALWIYPNGKKVWRLDYTRPADKKRTTVSLGDYPDMLPAQARAKREEYKESIKNGIDPLHKNDENITTLETIFHMWHERWLDTVTPSYALQVYRAIEANILPTLGNKDITTIEPRHIVEALTPMEARGSLEYLRRTKQNLCQVSVIS